MSKMSEGIKEDSENLKMSEMSFRLKENTENVEMAKMTEMSAGLRTVIENLVLILP